MTIRYELNLETFEAWNGAVRTLDRVRREGKCNELDQVLEELYPDGMSEIELNDLLRYDADSVYAWLGMRSEKQIREEIEEVEYDLEKLEKDLEYDLDDKGLSQEERQEIIDDYTEQINSYKEQIKELKEELEEL